MKELRLAIILLIFALSSRAEEWQMMTDTRSVRDIVAVGEYLWLATEGGLVEYSPERNHFRTFTTLDGLGGIGVARLEPDNSGGLWVAFDNRMLQRWLPERGVTHSIPSISQQEGIQTLNDLALDNRGLLVATSRGIARMIYSPQYDQWVWFEEYRKLGNFESDIAVRAIYIEGDTVWAATPQGVGRGILNSPPPLDWVNFGLNDGLPGIDIRDIVRAGGVLYACTEEGVARLNGNRWERIHGRVDVYKLRNFGDTLIAITSDGLSQWTGSQWIRFGDLRLSVNSAARDQHGDIWISFPVNGIAPGGIAALVDTAWQRIIPVGPPSNSILEALFTEDGYSCFTGGKSTGEYGFSREKGGNWERWTYPDYTGTPFHFQPRSLASDGLGGVWVGTFGGGVMRFDQGGEFTVFNADSSTGSRLVGYDAKPNNPLTPALASDSEGNVWIVNRGARTGNVLVCVPHEFIQSPDSNPEWYYFHRSNFQTFAEFDLIAIDDHNRKWLASTAGNPSGSGDQGVYVLDDRGTIADSTDDLVWGPLPGLPTREVLSMKYDPAGYIWAGTASGAYYGSISTPMNQFSFSQVYWMRDIPVYSIDVDPVGNKWFGTEFGVSILSPDLFTILRRITIDPPDRLPDARVRLVAIDPYTGEAYLGTSQGTSIIQTPYRDYGGTIAELTFEPNPFNPDRSRLIFTGSTLAGNAGARIFTPDGRLIRKLTHNDAAVGWDGKDDSGRAVADGVYLILTHNSAGQSARGKVAVIRR